MSHLSAERFVRVWEQSGSVTEASVRLYKAGYPDFEPNLTRITAHVLRLLGVNLKKMPLGELPDYVEQPATPEKKSRRRKALPASPPTPKTASVTADSSPAKALAAPSVPAECMAALADGRYMAWTRGCPNMAFAVFFANEMWPFRAGSND